MTKEIDKTVVLSYQWGSPAGVQVVMPLDEYANFQGTDTALFESTFGVPWHRIVEFEERQGHQQCSAYTKSRKRCKCIVGGVRFSSPTEWDAADKAGGYCFQHTERQA